MPSSNRRWILFFFCCASVLTSFNISALTAVIPAVARSLNISAGDAANMIPYYMIPYGISALVYAPLASKFTIKQLMVASTLLASLGYFIPLVSDSMVLIMVGRVITGMGAGAVTPLALMTLGKIFRKEIRGRVLGLFFSSSFVGAMLGLILSGFADWHWLFIVPAWAGVLLAIGFCFCPSQGMEAHSHLKVNYIDPFRLGGLRRILIFIFFMSLLFNGVCKWYGVYMDKIYSYPQWLISLLIILTAVACIIGQTIGGIITDKWGREQACTIGGVILGVSVMALAGHYSLIGLAIVLAMISIGWTIAHNGISTVLTDFSDTYRSELAALNSAVRFLSGGLGFYISGNFVQNNFGLTFLAIGFLMLFQVGFVKKVVGQKIGA
jgi:predicted MFS family arabinose efflux permease